MTAQHAYQDSERLETVRDVESLRRCLAAWRRDGATIGLVPTMGALHAGHMALVQQARAECDRVVATIFVNPIQFNEQTDLASYPRTEARDSSLLADAGTDLLFAPSAEEIYPEGFATTVSVAGITDCLCGVARPGHLSGVATVVSKLLLQSMPDVAYFGEKDYQQLMVVRRMARDLDIPVRIAAVPTVREVDGLALSSRNENLNADQRACAPALYRVLTALGERLAGGEDAGQVLAEGHGLLQEAGFERIDYLDLRDGETLASLDRARPPARLFVAAWLGPTRLIDNVPVV